MFRFIALPLCALVSIAAGGTIDRPDAPRHRWQTWAGFTGILVQPPQEALEPVPTVPPPEHPATPRAVSPHRTARRTCAARSLPEIAQAESGGDYGAQNRRSSASGKYQVLDSTWGGYAGVPKARMASPEDQERQAAELYRRSGAAPWNASC